ncbi:TPA: hypothetical protein ACGUPN_003382 [Vibrio vulnificus]|nr:hypothetical protein [Vibrio vulnificus]HDY7749514.1 hypothetical protein [Vibrio vulnificus]HDY7758853.1 hypothetical protein [Vibrio vulnificus]HDY7763509.1 hypothetical protein [Vibrio vulnificus]HDY7772677.1 hypothetical protein [Vibrio vulnificus]
MKNQQFSLLMSEVAQLVHGEALRVRDRDSLVCTYGEWSCRIENGAVIGLTGQIIVLVKLDSAIDEQHALKVNGHFGLTLDGYIAMLTDNERFYVRHKPMPTHPQQVLDVLSETISVVHQLKEELQRLCG